MHEHWTETQAKSWGKSVKTMQDAHRRSRVGRRIDAGMIVFFYPMLVGFSVYAEAYGVGLLVNVGFWWFFYSQYRLNLAAERLWLEAANHGQRMLVETMERALWHSEQLDVCLAGLRKLDKDDGFRRSRDCFIAYVRSWFWWTAFKLAKRLRIFLEWWNCKERA